MKQSAPSFAAETNFAHSGLVEGLDDLDAADVFNRCVVKGLCGDHGALEFFIVAAEHRQEAGNSQRHDEKHGKPHAPVLQKQQHQHRQRARAGA